MKTILKNGVLLFLLFIFGNGMAQEGAIHLNNSSFEGDARPGKEPNGWFDCGMINFPDETPPDIHTTKDSIFGVSQSVFEGETYLGLVVRENDSWESISQRLPVPLQIDSCYSFSIYLCKSEFFISTVRWNPDVTVNFTTPIKLRIWGGNSYCKRDELIAKSELIENTEWQKFSFVFQPTIKVEYIILEAFFQTPTFKIPNGNILLDKASPIVPISCKD